MYTHREKETDRNREAETERDRGEKRDNTAQAGLQFMTSPSLSLPSVGLAGVSGHTLYGCGALIILLSLSEPQLCTGDMEVGALLQG